MRIEYVSHSCFVIETGGVKIAFDPWITGSAYANQWHLFPKPVNIDPVTNADIILISHGHEDHLHEASLKLIQKNAHVVFPFQWRDGIKKYLNFLEFSNVTEAVSFKTYHFNGIAVTYLGYSLESVIVVECEDKVLVNINDALNSNHETAVNFLLKKIKLQWGKIDYLLSGWSGAGYFPNKVHYKDKDDKEVALIREQYFADNFCRFTKFLQPKIAIPFAPGFVLLSDFNRWINEVKFPRQRAEKYYNEFFLNDNDVKFPIMYPGDFLIDDDFFKVSEYHKIAGDSEIYGEVDDIFKKEILTANLIPFINETEISTLTKNLLFYLNKNKNLYSKEVISDAKFSIRFTDIEENQWLNISFNDDAAISRGNAGANDDRLVIATRASLVLKNLDRVWGGDLLSIGYGIDVTVFEELTLEKNLDIVCVRLISRYPSYKAEMVKHSGRILKYYFNNPALMHLWINQKIRLRPYVNKYPFNERDHWITFNKCDLCKVCHIPEVSFEKMQNLQEHI